MSRKKVLITMDSEAYDIYTSIPKGWRGALVSFAIKHLKKNRNAWKSFMNVTGISYIQSKNKENAKEKELHVRKDVEVEIEEGWG